MPNIASALKAEIERLARKETRRQMAPVSKASAGHRRQIAALKRELARLDKRISAAVKVPKTVVFLDALPKSTVGKILRRDLRGVN